ncbi:hypothetical protein [Rhizobacter sp. LjRoot28]|uniref:hypothetical protein n=1 Tax=Rhizobacter sp. LjRoot28 TaxID=3342309 RepID=UPI003ECD8C36
MTPPDALRPGVNRSVKPMAVLLGAVTVAYPFLVYAGITRLQPQWLALLLGSLALVRALVARTVFWSAAAAGAVLLAALSAVGNALLPLKLYPVLVNAVFLIVFAVSLSHPPSAIERLARLAEPDLPASGVAYTRRVTQVWCGFFVFNGAVALWSALWASNEVWALYNGLVSYLLMGLLFAGEWLVRRRVRARAEAGVTHG